MYASEGGRETVEGDARVSSCGSRATPGGVATEEAEEGVKRAKKWERARGRRYGVSGEGRARDKRKGAPFARLGSRYTR